MVRARLLRVKLVKRDTTLSELRSGRKHSSSGNSSGSNTNNNNENDDNHETEAHPLDPFPAENVAGERVARVCRDHAHPALPQDLARFDQPARTAGGHRARADVVRSYPPLQYLQTSYIVVAPLNSSASDGGGRGYDSLALLLSPSHAVVNRSAHAGMGFSLSEIAESLFVPDREYADRESHCDENIGRSRRQNNK